MFCTIGLTGSKCPDSSFTPATGLNCSSSNLPMRSTPPCHLSLSRKSSLPRAREWRGGLPWNWPNANGSAPTLIFPFPNAFLNLLCEKLSLKAPTPEDPFDPTNMTFTIMKRLPACLSRPGYEGLRNYFDDDRRQIKLLQLSQRIAHLFDQYLVFRPDIILNWDKGKQVQDDNAWQADLWREIASGNEHLHRVSLHADLIARLENEPAVSRCSAGENQCFRHFISA